MNTPRSITKKVVNIVVGTSVAFVTTNAIANNVTPKNKIQQIEVMAGSAVVGYYVSEKVSDWTDTKVDAVFDWYNEAFSKNL